MDAVGLCRDCVSNLANTWLTRGKSMPACHQRYSSLNPLGNKRAASTGVTVRASSMDANSMTITDNAMEPKKSPAGPSKIAIGKKAKTVVTVDAMSGMRNRLTEALSASSGDIPMMSRLRTSSVITIEPSTSSPRATTSPVSDIWWMGTSRYSSPAMDNRVHMGRITATTKAARQPKVTKSTASTIQTPANRLLATPARRASVYWLWS